MGRLEPVVSRAWTSLCDESTHCARTKDTDLRIVERSWGGQNRSLSVLSKAAKTSRVDRQSN